ncbi:MAG: iron-sulfur cluster repair di-iron protein [Microthrixaceae bacterium]
MSDIDPQQTLARLVTELPGSARIFERWGIDYCCHGQRALQAACADLNVDTRSVIAELDALGEPSPEEWATMAPDELTEHIVCVHHDYLREELPRLIALAEKVHSVHGGRHGELAEVAALVRMTEADLTPHMQREELVVFPAIRQMSTNPDFQPKFGNFDGPLSVLMAEHDNQGRLLDRLSEITADYTPPADGCASYAALYDGLRQLDQDTRLHVHKENNILFPAVKEMEAAVAVSS